MVEYLVTIVSRHTQHLLKKSTYSSDPPQHPLPSQNTPPATDFSSSTPYLPPASQYSPHDSDHSPPACPPLPASSCSHSSSSRPNCPLPSPDARSPYS